MIVGPELPAARRSRGRHARDLRRRARAPGARVGSPRRRLRVAALASRSRSTSRRAVIAFAEREPRALAASAPASSRRSRRVAHGTPTSRARACSRSRRLAGRAQPREARGASRRRAGRAGPPGASCWRRSSAARPTTRADELPRALPAALQRPGARARAPALRRAGRGAERARAARAPAALPGAHRRDPRRSARSSRATSRARCAASWPLVASLHVLFYGLALALALLAWAHPDLIYSFISQEHVARDRADVRPRRAGRRPRSATPATTRRCSASTSGTTSRSRSAPSRAVSRSAWVRSASVILNALQFGLIASHLVRVGLGGAVLLVRDRHGAFELTAILLAGVAGMRLGLAVLAPGARSRVAALRAAALLEPADHRGRGAHAGDRRGRSRRSGRRERCPRRAKYGVGAALVAAGRALALARGTVACRLSGSRVVGAAARGLRGGRPRLPLRARG